MALSDPYKIRLGDELLAYLDTVPDAPEYVRAAIRWARALDLTEDTVSELLEARAVVRRAGDVYRDPTRAIDAIVGDALMGPLDALASLESAGWSTPYLCAACDALNGTWLAGEFGVGGIQLELHDAERIAIEGGGSLVAKHGGDPDRWPGLVASLNEAGARALRVVVTEFWRGHLVVEKRLGYGPEE